MFTKTVIRQGKRIIELDKRNNELAEENAELKMKIYNTSRENLNLIGEVDDTKEDCLMLLENLKGILESNDYGRTDIKIRKAIEEINKELSTLAGDR